MRDDRNLLRWLDMSWFAPLPLSLGLAIWTAMTRPDPGLLAILLLVQMALLATACSVPAALAAGRSRVWWRRLAPARFQQTVHRAWREQTGALLAFGLIGPVAAALRAHEMGATALTCWALALPLLGAVLGTLAAWAASGSLQPAGLALWPVTAGLALAMGLTTSTWHDATPPAVVALGASLLLSALAWRTSLRLQPRWAGVGARLATWRRSRQTGLQRWHWDTLAFDDADPGRPAGRVWMQWLPYVLLGFSGAAPLKALMADDIAGRTALHFSIYVSYLLAFASSNLTVRVAHWRLRLAPVSLSPRTQVAVMLAESTLLLWALTCGFVGFHMWSEGLAPAAGSLPLARAAVDAALCVGLAAWVRGLDNRQLVMTLTWLALSLLLAGSQWLLHAQGLSWSRGPATLAAQAAFAALFMTLAMNAWRHRVPRGLKQLQAPQAD